MNSKKCNEHELQMQLRENRLSAEMARHLTVCSSCQEIEKTFKLIGKLHSTTIAMQHNRVTPAAVLWKFQIRLMAKKRRHLGIISLISTTLTAVFALMIAALVLLAGKTGDWNGSAIQLPLIILVFVALITFVISPSGSNTGPQR